MRMKTHFSNLRADTDRIYNLQFTSFDSFRAFTMGRFVSHACYRVRILLLVPLVSFDVNRIDG